MNKNDLIKEFIMKETEIQINESASSFIFDKVKDIFSNLADNNYGSGTKAAVIALLMSKFGLRQHDVTRIMNIKNDEMRDLEIRYMVDKVFDKNLYDKGDKGMLSYLYFGRKPQVSR